MNDPFRVGLLASYLIFSTL